MIRDATLDDSAAIAQLLGELGYPTTADAVRTRLGKLTVRVFVDDSEPLGVIAIDLLNGLHDDRPVAMIMALVVSANARRRGTMPSHSRKPTAADRSSSRRDSIAPTHTRSTSRSVFREAACASRNASDAAADFCETHRRLTRPMLMFRRSLVLFLLLAATSAFAQRTNRGPDSPGTGDPTEHDVPWKFLEKGVAPAPAPVMLYWLPANAKETEQSPLLTSRVLFEASARCLSYLVVLPGDSATVAKLHVTGDLPQAVITDSHGTVVRTVNAVHGVLPIAAVERAVRDEVNARDEAMYHGMTEARKVAATDKNAAIALYRKVWDDRCLFPMAGTEAQHALKELGVVVTEPVSAPLPDPNLMKPGLPSKPSGH